MLKSICKNVAWLAVPLTLALGCAANRTTTTADVAYPAQPMLTATSAEPEQRIYSTDPAAVAARSDISSPPPGANAADWSLAASIQRTLTQDPTLAPLGSKLIAEVGKDGTVTLKGVVKTTDEQKRVRDTIANVPGVKSVNDDQLKIGTYRGGGGRLDVRQWGW